MNTHDHIFKQMFRNFFGELLALTMPWLRRAPVRPRLLRTELFADLPRRRLRQVDLVALVRRRRDARAAVVHVEIEARARPEMRRRMCEYNLLLRLGYGRSVLPLVVYLEGGPAAGLDPVTVEDECDGFELGRLRYLAFSLARCSAGEYLERPEPLAWALAALMQPGDWSPEQLREECETRILGAELPAGQRELLLECVRQYLPRDGEDAVTYDRASQGGTMSILEPEEIDLHTVDPEELTPRSRIEYRGWKLGMEMGRSEGRAEGRAEGQAEGERRLLVNLLEARFGPLSEADRRRVEAIDSTEELERLARRLMEATSLADLGLDGNSGPSPS